MSWDASPRPVPPPPRAPPLPPPAPPPTSRLPALLRRRAPRPPPRAPPGALVCSGGAWWGEVAQVVDLRSDLIARGLSEAAAEAVLDAGLSLRLSLYVCASGGPGCLSRSGSCDSPGSGDSSGCGGCGGGCGSDAINVAPAAAAPAPPPPAADAAFGLVLDDGSADLKSFGCFVRRPSSYHFYSGRLPVPLGGGWQRLEHVVAPCPPGFRRAVVLIRGRGAPLTHPLHPMSSLRGAGGGGCAVGVRFGAPELAFVPAAGPDAAAAAAPPLLTPAPPPAVAAATPAPA
jgi:hypothetical protein